MPSCRQHGGSNFVWASMSAISSSKTATSLVMASTSPRAWRHLPSRAGSASARRRTSRCETSSISRLRTRASNRSRTSPGQCGRIALCRGSTAQPITGAAAAATEPSLTEKPSIAVLPFQNLSGDPEQEYFVDGMVEDIITALSRVGLFFVIARNSSFAYKGKSVDIKQVGRELGAHYVLEGSIGKAANRVRITGQLIEATTGHHIWADRFDGSLDDIFDLQDRLTESVVGSIVPSVQRAEIARAYAKPTENLDAYNLYLRALERFYTRSQSACEEALTLLERAIRLDPGYALAKALFGQVVVLRDAGGWSTAEEKTKATSLAREAAHSNRDDPNTLRWAAQVLSHIAHDHELALSTIARAIRLNPNSAQALVNAGWVHLHAGVYEPALGYFEQAIRLSPLGSGNGYYAMGCGSGLPCSGTQ